MEKIILIIIGITAAYFTARLLWKEAKGEVQCNCSQGSCSAKDKKNCGKK